MINPWLAAHNKEVDATLKRLLEKAYEGSDGSIDFMRLHSMLKGCVSEILKLQSEVDKLKNQMKGAPSTDANRTTENKG